MLPSGGQRATTYNPDGSTNVNESFAVGQKSRSVQRQGWATQLETVYTRGTHSERGGGLWEEQRQNGTRWNKSFAGLNGVHLKAEQPTFGNAGVATITFDIDNAGRAIKVTPPLGAATLTSYDAKGEVSQTVLDVDGSGTLTAPDRVSRSTRESVASVTFGGRTFGAGDLQTSSVLNDAGQEIVLSRQWSSFDGLSSAGESRGLVTSSTRTKPLDGASTATSTAADGTTQVQISANGLPVETLSYAAGSTVPLRHTLTGYDTRWRGKRETERRHADANIVTDLVTNYTFFDSGQLKSVRTPYDTANNSAGTIYTRDILGREIAIQLPDGSTRTTASTDSTGTVRVSGSQTYPTETRSDAFGQMVELKTWQDFAGNTGLATTYWAYDSATGLLVEKQYADLKKVQYQYDAVGRLAKRTWARGIETTYGYTSAGNLDSVNYSDATPAVSYSYNRNGQMLSAGGYSYAYNPATLLPTSQTIPLPGTAPQEARVITHKRDALLRDSGLVLNLGAASELETTWGYDNAGRPKTVSADNRTFTYDYVAGRPELLSTVAGPVHTVVNTWEPLRGVLSSKANQRTGPSAATVSAYGYTVNNLGQRTSVRTAGEAFTTATADWDWSYNSKGELISAASPSDQTRNKAFRYDDIGNRAWASAGAQPLVLDNPQAEPTGGAITRYTANALNQYTAIATGAPSSPTYDDDGNMLDDGTLLYTWDGENRLTSVTRKAGGSPLAAYAYDHQSRRVKKSTTADAPQGAATIAFVYDGWNIIAEYTISGGHATLNATNVWGTDLSGSQQGAGGVGGLIIRDTDGTALHYAYDANGNITELFDGSGSIAAHYEYGPFGEPLRATGPMAEGNPFRFSTKYQDAETGLSYYGYRYYQPATGRWINRDPIEEIGGVNIYGFSKNSAVGSIDTDGRRVLNSSDDPMFQDQQAKPSSGADDYFSNLNKANSEFDSVLFDFLVGGGGSGRSYDQSSKWTQQLMYEPVYNRMRNEIIRRARKSCACQKPSSLVGVTLPWDDSANDAPFYAPVTDLINYATGFWMKSLGSKKGMFTIVKVDCVARTVSYTMRVSDQFRWGSATRVPFTDNTSFWPALPPQADGGFLGSAWLISTQQADNPFGNSNILRSISIEWQWSETLTFNP